MSVKNGDNPQNLQTPNAFGRAGWGDNDPYSGSLRSTSWNEINSSYGIPMAPRDIAPRDDAAAKIHITMANQSQARGDKHDYFGPNPVYNGPIITATSYLMLAGAPATQPSEWMSRVQLPYWEEGGRDAG